MRGTTLLRRREECESGRIGTTGNRVLGDQPWVQIPPPPLRNAQSPSPPDRYVNVDPRLGPEAGEPPSGLPAHSRCCVAPFNRRSVEGSRGVLRPDPDTAHRTPRRGLDASAVSGARVMTSSDQPFRAASIVDF